MFIQLKILVGICNKYVEVSLVFDMLLLHQAMNQLWLTQAERLLRASRCTGKNHINK